jgi:hypothetical protein
VTRRNAWLAALTALVVARSAVFVFWSGSHFDSDQAVTGLMARHLSELRAFPVFWYGQTYMLGVEAWIAAPVMAVAGATVTALKLPLLAMNVAIALLLFRGFTIDGLDEPRAAFATLFFALAAPITTAHFLTANGGNVEPLLYVLLIWTLRRRPILMGVVLGLGFLNREFTIYGAIALIVIEAYAGTLLSRAGLLKYGQAFGTAATVWVAVALLRRVSSAAGPGTSIADLSTHMAANNLAQVIERLCFDPRAIVSGIRWICTRTGRNSSAWNCSHSRILESRAPFVRVSPARRGCSCRSLSCPSSGFFRGLTPIGSGFRLRLDRRGVTFTPYLLVVAALVDCRLSGGTLRRCGFLHHALRTAYPSLARCGLAAWYLRQETPYPFARRGSCAAWPLSVFRPSLTFDCSPSTRLRRPCQRSES